MSRQHLNGVSLLIQLQIIFKLFHTNSALRPLLPWHRLIALDYPPFFAYFEFLLSLPARLIDKHIVDLSNLNYDAWSVVAYQRTTVILTELVLGAALLRYAMVSLGV